ncbi:UdgX family uracil-DNA binding protein [Sphingobium sufflavum]|uniref:UdgX family uracil-DNA binding protein n=1 Tax=Sphingobium sufflavum TaxID=1129547 RepID=UPI001F22C695|nr:UdgX family uracil-DNA binding protein [Sphingobium sufflavum]MCE7795974.1 UdgX family uracil-DNA binding protein [Sphingobium sufflavum]
MRSAPVHLPLTPPAILPVTLAAPDDFTGWRDAARALLAAAIPPDRIDWTVAGTGMADLFAVAQPLPAPVTTMAQPVPRALLHLLRHALLHRAPGRFALAYRTLWRLRERPRLHLDPADPDMIALAALAKSVRRDLHKMHAFVRFRKVGEADGRERFAAWFEPDHHIGRAVAGFFRNRFAGMDWLIVTPQVSIGWDGATLREGPGGTPADVPGGDAVEAEWRAYYASIFNPARVKVAMMKKEMPVRYWRNLPESALIPELIRRAETRVDAMVETVRSEADLFAPAEPGGRRFESLTALYAALAAEDTPPSPGFSSHVVPGEGLPSATILLVGEQPGEQEDKAGRPFVGPAGQVLDACLAEAGIDRASAFLTNAVKRFKFTSQGKRRLHATPNAGDIAHYRWWLAEEIRLVNPTIVVALGATALHALSGRKQALAPVRGDLLPWQDRRLLATVHPSYLLRLPDAQARDIERDRMVRDLRKALAAA